MAIPNNKTATEIMLLAEQTQRQAGLWSDELMKQYKSSLEMMLRPKRSAGAQMLRDAALGHPEYPEDEKWPENWPMTSGSTASKL